MSQPGRVFDRAHLLNCLYPNGKTVVDRFIDVHIGKLRQKIETDPASPCLFETVHSVGYRLAEAVRP